MHTHSFTHTHTLYSFTHTHTHIRSHTLSHTHTLARSYLKHSYLKLHALAQALTCVDTDVARQAAFGGKGHPAAFTDVGPVPCVSPHVTLSTGRELRLNFTDTQTT